MYLLINTNNNQIALASGTEQQGGFKWKDIAKEASFALQIKEALKAEDLQLDDIQGIVIMQGEGSYSDTRTGIVFANMLKLLKSVPVVAIKEDELSKTMPLGEAIEQLLHEEDKYLHAQYSSEPNITKS